MALSLNRYGFRPHTRAELHDAAAGPALDASWLPSFSAAFARVRGTLGRLVTLHRVRAVIAYDDVEFAVRFEDVILPAHPDYRRVAALVRAEADLARRAIDARRELVAQARTEWRSLPRRSASRPRDQQRSRVYSWSALCSDARTRAPLFPSRSARYSWMRGGGTLGLAGSA